jgi:hypothetical protein
LYVFACFPVSVVVQDLLSGVVYHSLEIHSLATRLDSQYSSTY